MYRAVKIVSRSSFNDQGPFERELSGIRSFEPVSRSHEGFVDILHVGINERQDCFFYVMELGDDQTDGQRIDPQNYIPKTLAKEIVRRGPFPPGECLQLGLALSQAVAELHKNGLVHRDIKPSNIIFVGGIPKLADIGLVAELDKARSLVGTQGFIPPEGPGTAQADVYGLGKVLYEASTGRDRQDFPELPTRWGESPDHAQMLELNEVILQACQLDPAKRYKTATDLHAELLLVSNGKSVKRLRLLERRFATFKRAAVVAALGLVWLGGLSYAAFRTWRNGLEQRQREAGAAVANGIHAAESGDPLASLPYFAEALRLDQGDPALAREQRLRFASALDSCPRLTRLWVQPKQVNSAQFSRDGKRALTAEHYGNAAIYDLETGRLQGHAFSDGWGLSSAAFSPSNTFIVTASQDNAACLWATATMEKTFRWPHPGRVFNARFSPDGSNVVTCCEDGVARLWEVASGRSLRQFAHPSNPSMPVVFAAFSPNGQLLATASYDTTARLWNLQDGTAVGSPLHHTKWVTCAAFSPDGQKLVTACEDHNAHVWDVRTGRRLSGLGHRDVVKSAEFSPDGRLILTGSLDGTARLWFSENYQPAGPILKHGERVTQAAFSPDGREVVLAGVDGTVRVWDLAGIMPASVPVRPSFSDGVAEFPSIGQAARENGSATNLEGAGFADPTGSGTSNCQLQISPGATFALGVFSKSATATNPGTLIQPWDLRSAKRIGPGIWGTNTTAGAAISETGNRVVSFGGAVAQVWDAPTGEAASAPLVHNERIFSAALDPTGTRLATCSGYAVQVWDVGAAQLAFSGEKFPITARYAEFSRDGNFLVACSWDEQFTRGCARVWNVATGQPISPELWHEDGVLRASFSPDGKRIATAGEDFVAKIWDVRTGRQIGQSLRHEHQVKAASFSPDGTWVVTACRDHTARIWSAETGEPLTPPLRHLAELVDAKFLADGTQILAVTTKGPAWLSAVVPDSRPLQEITAFASLLSGETMKPEGQRTPGLTNGVSVWENLRGKFPSEFVASQMKVWSWHQFQALESESREQWTAAEFHLERLQAMQPGNETLRRRLARASAPVEQ
jgi:WD40 repeat protein